MRDVEDGEFNDAIWMEEGEAPGNGGAPIVAGEEETRLIELISDGEDIGGEMA